MIFEDVPRQPEYVPYARRWFFERLTAGLLTPEQIRGYAGRLDLDLEAEAYAVALLELPPEPREATDFFTDPAGAVRGELLAFFLKYADYIPFDLGPTLCAVLVKGENRQMPELIRRCVDTVRREYTRRGLTDWHMAVSGPVGELEHLPACWEEATRLWAWRYLRPEQNIFLPDTAEADAEEEACSTPDGAPETAGLGTLETAAAYIRRHCGEPDLDLSRTAAAAGVTASYLSALFRKGLGRTFTQYVTDCRMELARQLLRTTDQRAAQIARAVGFRDPHYFGVRFRKTQGCTPAQFRAGEWDDKNI